MKLRWLNKPIPRVYGYLRAGFYLDCPGGEACQCQRRKYDRACILGPYVDIGEAAKAMDDLAKQIALRIKGKVMMQEMVASTRETVNLLRNAREKLIKKHNLCPT